MKTFRYEKAELRNILSIVKEHSKTLSSPWESFMEENLFSNQTYAIYDGTSMIGYANVQQNTLFSFYVRPSHFQCAPTILEDFVQAFQLELILVLTHDPLLSALIMEWEYEVQDKYACFFTDQQNVSKPEIKAHQPVFREATISESDEIRSQIADFFDPLEDRINKHEIFVLKEEDALLGCGIVEIGQIQTDCVSIGMITCKEHRNQGVAQMILWNLKQWAYEHQLRPIAGCWYYNVISRKCLESCGMMPTGKSYTIKLIEKKTLPLRTGNPPGELL